MHLTGDLQPVCQRVSVGSSVYSMMSLPGGIDPYTGFNYGYATVDGRPARIPLCVGTRSVCNRGTANLHVQGRGPNGLITAIVEPGHCTEEFIGINPAYLSIWAADNSEARLAAGDCLNRLCDPAALDNTCRFPEHMYAYELVGSCLTPNQFAAARYGDECQQLADELAANSASEPLLFEQNLTTTPVTPDIISICDLKTSCGNHVCDTGCEDTKSCPADCAPVTTTPDQKPVVSQPPTEPPTDKPTEVVTPSTTPEGADGKLCGDGICQAGEGPDWCGDCVEQGGSTGGGSTGGGKTGGGKTGGGEKQPVCGDGVCDASEKGCGVCSADCGPC